MATTRFGPLAETPQQYFPHTDRANATVEAALVDFEGTKRERHSSLHSVRPNHPYRSGLPKPRTAPYQGRPGRYWLSNYASAQEPPRLITKSTVSGQLKRVAFS
jgi:hypothetical protein